MTFILSLFLKITLQQAAGNSLAIAGQTNASLEAFDLAHIYFVIRIGL